MPSNMNYRVYGLASTFRGWLVGVVIAPCPQKAIETFCRLHALYPAQVAMLYSYPLLQV